MVTMWHSLEHVHRPLAILREAYRLLVPGGKIVVATPNLESLPFYWFGSSWFGLDLPRHLTHFTPKALREMLETAGFRVESVRMLRHADWLRSSARLAVRQGRGGAWSRLLKWKPAAKLVTRLTATHDKPCSRARITSGTVDMPTRSAPSSLAMRISAGVSNEGPLNHM